MRPLDHARPAKENMCSAGADDGSVALNLTKCSLISGYEVKPDPFWDPLGSKGSLTLPCCGLTRPRSPSGCHFLLRWKTIDNYETNSAIQCLSSETVNLSLKGNNETY